MEDQHSDQSEGQVSGLIGEFHNPIELSGKWTQIPTLLSF